MIFLDRSFKWISGFSKMFGDVAGRNYKPLSLSLKSLLCSLSKCSKISNMLLYFSFQSIFTFSNDWAGNSTNSHSYNNKLTLMRQKASNCVNILHISIVLRCLLNRLLLACHSIDSNSLQSCFELGKVLEWVVLLRVQLQVFRVQRVERVKLFTIKLETFIIWKWDFL